MRSCYWFWIFVCLLFQRILFCNGNYFKEIEHMFMAEKGRQATNVLQEDLAGGVDQPKLITISYPTTPDVTIENILPNSFESEGNTICLILRIRAPDLNLHLGIRCNQINDFEPEF